MVKAESQTYGIVQSPFMLEKAKTKAFIMNLSVKNNELNYNQMTSLHIIMVKILSILIEVVYFVLHTNRINQHLHLTSTNNIEN